MLLSVKGCLPQLILTISSICCNGSSICFDYPLTGDNDASRRNRELAAAAGEQMKASYSRRELEDLLSDAGFLIYEHLCASEANNAFFAKYNSRNPGHALVTPEGIAYCLAVKKRG